MENAIRSMTSCSPGLVPDPDTLQEGGAMWRRDAVFRDAAMDETIGLMRIEAHHWAESQREAAYVVVAQDYLEA